MSPALASSPLGTHEPVPSAAVGAPILAAWPLDVPVSALPSALTTVALDRANRKTGNPDPGRAASRASAVHLRRDAQPRRVSVPARAATFSGRGVRRAGGQRQIHTRHKSRKKVLQRHLER